MRTKRTKNAPFSNLSPDPLPPALLCPLISNSPPPPGVGRDGRRSRASPFAAYLLPGGFYHARPASPLVPHSSLVPRLFSPPRRHLFSRAVFGSSSIHAVIAPRRTPGKTPSAAHASGHRIRVSTSQRPVSLDKHDEAGDGTMGWRAVLIRCPRSSFPVASLPRVVVVVPSHIARRVSAPGRQQFRGAYIPRRFPQLISSAPRPAVSIRVSKQDGVAVLGPVIVSPPRLVIASSRPSCRRAGRRASRPPSAGSVSGPVSTAPEDMATARPRSHHNKQAGRAARPRPAPSCRAGGEFLTVSSTDTARQASRAAASSHPARCVLTPAHRLIVSSASFLVSGSGAASSRRLVSFLVSGGAERRFG